MTSVPGQQGAGQASREPKKPQGAKGEFDNVLEKTIARPEGAQDLTRISQPLKFSAHAAQRLSDRKIAMDQQTMARVSHAVDKAAAKGVEDTLILTDKAALIVSVKNRTIITAMDRGSMSGNVFTNIDGAVIV
ncbi:MAG: hypothetical protein A2583_02375 [Bdellovibrionales bacterium RIFOXYD1_FULL_53_11]|nr:MAG: hypothetical protein A2583_02375 [Bdellovibrionales bacterium RIFOXYD1_FULL_53_11]